jgi:hypothetical protein
MDQGLVTLEGHIANSAPVEDRQRAGIVVRRHVAAVTNYSLFSREAAKVTRGVANVSYGAIADRGQLEP